MKILLDECVPWPMHRNLAGRRIAILELSSNDLRRIEAASALIEDAVGKMQPNEFTHLTIP